MASRFIIYLAVRSRKSVSLSECETFVHNSTVMPETCRNEGTVVLMRCGSASCSHRGWSRCGQVESLLLPALGLPNSPCVYDYAARLLLLLLLLVCVWGVMYMCMACGIHMWRSEDNIIQPVLFFYLYMSSRA